MARTPEAFRWLWRWYVWAGALVLSVFVFAVWDDVQYHLRGQAVEARVVEETVTPAGFSHGSEYDDRGTRPQYSHRLLYEYTGPAGLAHTGRHEWQSDSDRRAYQPGDPIDVQYRTDRPHVSRLARPGMAVFGWACLFAVPAAIGIVFLAYALNRNDGGLALAAWLGRRLPGGRRSGAVSRGEGEPLVPYAWEMAIRKNVGHYGRLPASEQVRLQQLLRGFLEGKEWVGCNGFEVTDEVKATVAAQACVLLLGAIDHDHFASVKSILLYPSTFGTAAGSHGMEGHQATLGQAWYRGPVILAWDEVLAGGREPDGGRNVVYHEFAHQLDFAGEGLERATAIDREESRRRRSAVFQAEYEALVRAAAEGKATLLDQYGATDPREFFAVATECFFGKPIEMAQAKAALYEVMRDFYGQDPADRLRRYRSMVDSTARRDRLGSDAPA